MTIGQSSSDEASSDCRSHTNGPCLAQLRAFCAPAGRNIHPPLASTVAPPCTRQRAETAETVSTTSRDVHLESGVVCAH